MEIVGGTHWYWSVVLGCPRLKLCVKQGTNKSKVLAMSRREIVTPACPVMTLVVYENKESPGVYWQLLLNGRCHLTCRTMLDSLIKVSLGQRCSSFALRLERRWGYLALLSKLISRQIHKKQIASTEEISVFRKDGFPDESGLMI